MHVVHLATADALPEIAAARAEGLALTVETCPHYLTFAAEEVPDGDTRFKCAPPIRSAANRERLWEGSASGADRHHRLGPLAGAARFEATGHGGPDTGLGRHRVAPARPARRLDRSPPPRFRAGGRRALDVRPVRAARRPVRRKGAIAPGHDADLVIIDPEAAFVVDAAALHHRHKATPYEGRTLAGQVVATYLRGRRVATAGQPEGEPTGRPIGSKMAGLDRLNELGEAEARAALLRCCGSRRWAEQMSARRPFASSFDLLAEADHVWAGLDRPDRLEAFASHPKIGDLDALRARFASTASWATAEQSGVQDASEATLRGLAEGNRDYEARFGTIFIVCATGKTAGEMLELLRGRLGNDPETELGVASSEQAAIMRLRLRRLCS